jgi:quercetin dioxygenase-like cupin family protein
MGLQQRLSRPEILKNRGRFAPASGAAGRLAVSDPKLKSLRLLLIAAVLIPLLVDAEESKSTANASHIMLEAKQTKWGDAPPVLRKGAQFAVLSGDPGKQGPFVIRLKMPAGYKVAPHWHPTDEQVTVIAGTFSLGMGDNFDAQATKTLTSGGYALLPAEMHHFAWSKTGATIQVHGMGPFALNYVNPTDDPRPVAAK